MSTLPLDQVLRSFIPEEQFDLSICALMQDELVWNALNDAEFAGKIETQWPRSTADMTPAALALFSIDPAIVSSGYPETSLPAEILEEALLTYETYRTQSIPVKTLKEAGLLAIAIFEKYRQSGDWGKILYEILDDKERKNEDYLIAFWKTPLVALTGIVDDPKELLQKVFQSKNRRNSNTLFRHLVLSLPSTQEEKVNLVTGTLYSLPVEVQAGALQSFYQNGNDALLQKAAKGLLSRHLIQDTENKTARDFWQEPEKYLALGDSLRELSAIAQFAGEYETAEKLLKANERILKTQLTGNLIQSASLKFEQNQSMESELEQIPSDILAETEIATEISRLGAETIGLKGIAENISSFEMNEAVKMYQAGNISLARDTAAKSIQPLLNGENSSAIGEFSLRALSWKPGNMIDQLIEMELWPEAASLNRKLLILYPTNELFLKKAATIAGKQGDRALQLAYLEKVNLLNSSDESSLRKLAEAYLNCEDWQSAYRKYQKLISEFSSTEQDDLLGMAKSALKCGEIGTALDYAQKVLSSFPENSQAMAISGYAYHRQGNPEKAISLLDQAIETNSEDSEPWLLRADLYAESGETAKSVSTLRTALTAHPGNEQIKMRLLKTLIDNGQASEALTVLEDEQIGKSSNKEFALLKLRAMKLLNLPELANIVEQLYELFPNDTEIQKEYSAAQLQKGNQELVKKLLEPVVALNPKDPELTLAYCDAVLGENYRRLHSHSFNRSNSQENAERLLHNVLMDDPENVNARMLLAETLIHQGKTEKAFELLTNLMGDSDAQNSSWLDRIQAGFAWAALALEKADMALGAIQNVVEANPDWAGAGQTLAEIDVATGEIADAVDQARDVLEIAPDVIECVEWFADLMSDLNKQDEAEKILLEVSKTHKEKSAFLLKLAEFKIGRGEFADAKGIIEGLTHSLPKVKSDAELVKTAKVFDKLGEKDTTEECLKLRITNAHQNKENAYSDLAGYLYSKGKFPKALEVIAQAENDLGTQRWIELLKADTLHANGNAQAALELLNRLDAANNSLPDTQDLEFVPAQWAPLLQPQASTDSLIRSLAFESGDYQEVLESIGAESILPSDVSLGIEAGYASGNTAPTQPWMSANPEDETIYQTSLLTAQVAELLLDAAKNEQAALVIKRGLELYPQDRILLANASRYSNLIGDVNTAEALFDQVLPQYSQDNSYASASSVCALRNLLKTAAVLNRWTEALKWQSVLLQANQRNLSTVQLSLQVLVQALEFSQFTENLGVEQHFDSSQENIQKTRNNLINLVATLESQKNHFFDRWVARAKVILEPSQANIRSLALKTPEADDVAAMMLALHHSGQTNTALQLTGKYVGDPRVTYAWAYCLKDSDPAKALEVLKNGKKSAVVLPWSSVLAESLCRKTGENYSAINEIEEAVQWWPLEPEWHVRAAECWQATGDTQNAINHLEEAEKLLPDDTRMKYLLGKAYLQANETESSIKILETASKNSANHYETWETLMQAYYASGQKEKALAAAEKASSINGFSVKPTLLSARINLDNGDVKKALELAQSAVKHEEQDAESLVMLAKTWLANGNKLQALQVLEKVTHAKNVTVQVMIDQAKLIQKVNGAASAKVILETLEQKYPENIEVLNLLSGAQLASGDKVSAQNTAQRSLKLQDLQPKVHRFVGKLDLEAGHLDQAIYHFSQAIAEEPQDIEVYLDLSDAYIQQRDFEVALETLNRAIEISPSDIRPLMAAANLLRNGKDFAKAESRLRQAAEIAPNDLNIRRQLGAVIALNLVHSSQEASSNI